MVLNNPSKLKRGGETSIREESAESCCCKQPSHTSLVVPVPQLWLCGNWMMKTDLGSTIHLFIFNQRSYPFTLSLVVMLCSITGATEISTQKWLLQPALVGEKAQTSLRFNFFCLDRQGENRRK